MRSPAGVFIQSKAEIRIPEDPPELAINGSITPEFNVVARPVGICKIYFSNQVVDKFLNIDVLINKIVGLLCGAVHSGQCIHISYISIRGTLQGIFISLNQ